MPQIRLCTLGLLQCNLKEYTCLPEEVFLCTAPVPQDAGQGALQGGAELMLQTATPAQSLNEAGSGHVEMQVSCIWHQGLVSELHLKTRTSTPVALLELLGWLFGADSSGCILGGGDTVLRAFLSCVFCCLFFFFIVTSNKTYHKPLDPAFPFIAFFSVNEFNPECF